MPIKIIKADITTLKVDAIVNAANKSLLGGGGVDGAIHQAAGPILLLECKELGGCKVGEAKITKGYNLDAKYIIHTVGPIWQGGNHNEEALLKSCYISALKLAKAHKVKSIAFPLISSGAYGYPRHAAMQVAMSTFSDFLDDHNMDIYLVIYDSQTFALSETLYANIEKYIGKNYVDAYIERFEFDHARIRESSRKKEHTSRTSHDLVDELLFSLSEEKEKVKKEKKEKRESIKAQRVLHSYASSKEANLDDVVKKGNETFSESLIRLIVAKGLKDADVYKKVFMDRRLFSKIRSKKHYQPSKPTAVALAIALQLGIDDTLDLIGKAGFTLSYSSIFDIIIRFFIENELYDVFDINDALYKYEQPLLFS